MISPFEAAERLSLSCFLNAYLREHPEISNMVMPEELQQLSGVSHAFCLVDLEHPELASVWLPLQRHSRVGRHQYASSAFARDHQGNIQKLELLDLAGLLLQKDQPSEGREMFLKRLKESRLIIAEALTKRAAELEASQDRNLSFLEAEQLLIAGHSFHPTPKSRDEFSADDRERYSPEMGASFPLAWVLADPDCVLMQKSVHFDQDWLEQLRLSDPIVAQLKRGDQLLLPLHPWQAEKLKTHPSLQKALARGALTFLEPQGRLWYPTSSLRSLYCPQAPYMLKFSLSLKLTNSIRHLLPHEVERGLQVHELLASDYGAALKKQSGLRILNEPAYFMLLGDDGQGVNESLVVCRDNPIHEADESQPQILATLTQEAPDGGDNRMVRHIRAFAAAHGKDGHDAARVWFQKFCAVALEPFLIAQADFGVLFGAHQQNMLLVLKDHEPHAVHYRDCQGTGYAAWAYPRLSTQVKLDPGNGNILPAAMETALFIYYLIINSGFNVIAAIADSGLVTEEELLGDLRAHLQKLLGQSGRDEQVLRDILYKESLMYKGNFQCSVQGLNENTSADPLRIYTPIPNPLVSVPGRSLVYETADRQSVVTIQDEDTRILAFRDPKRTMEFHWAQGRLTIHQDAPGGEAEDLQLRVLEYVFGRERQLLSLDCGGTTFHREEFFQNAALWHHRGRSEGVLPERWISTHGRPHPQRPVVRPGTLYRRYLPGLDQTLTFELFDLDRHLDIFHAWQNQPRVAQFWEMAEPREKLEAYIKKMQDDPHQRPVMAFLNERPIGYFEVYWTPEDRLGPYYDADPFDRGYHFLIGDVMALGRKGTPDIIQSMVHFIFLDDPRTRRVMGEPRHDNIKLLRYLATIPGWVKIKEFDFPHKRAALLQIKREDFFTGGSL